MRTRTAVSLVLTALYGFLCGCAGPKKTWSAETPSPDGSWLALAQSQQWSGPGNAYDATTVYLKQASGPRIEVLEFSNQAPVMNLKMQWVSPRHLQVTYGENAVQDHVDVDFQAVKCGDVEISLQHAPADAARNPRSP
jgi:hypothetical protein